MVLDGSQPGGFKIDGSVVGPGGSLERLVIRSEPTPGGFSTASFDGDALRTPTTMPDALRCRGRRSRSLSTTGSSGWPMRPASPTLPEPWREVGPASPR